MQIAKPRARYIHPGQVVVYAKTYNASPWYFYDVTLSGALRSYYAHAVRSQVSR